MDRMFSIALFSLVIATAFAGSRGPRPYIHSFSPSVGSGSGVAFDLQGTDRITAVRVWEAYSNYIYGIQVRFGFVWSRVVGYPFGNAHELELYDGEHIVQISGKYAHYIQSLVFVTSGGRFFFVGQPAGHSFNMFPKFMGSYLVFLSGRFHGALTGLSGHWGTFPSNSANAIH